ncbi:MAG: DUF418 domain-containing protein [Planctomycetota bacterium]
MHSQDRESRQVPLGDLQPTDTKERVVSLDVLRGFAVFGILLMNVQSFSMPSTAYSNPHAYGDLSGINGWIWYGCHLFADLKFMAIFSMLFGAGIVMVSERRESQGLRTAGFHYRRLFWLLIIGLIHAYLIWYGDILVIYAMTGGLVFWARRFSPRWLLALSLVLLLVGSGLQLATAFTMPYWDEQDIAGIQQDWAPSEEVLAEEIEMYRSGWLSHAPHRMEVAFVFHTFLYAVYFVWRVGALMLIGMAMQKLSILDAKRQSNFYATMAVACLGIGLPMIFWGIQQNDAHDWDVGYSMFIGSQYNYWGSLFVACGYIAFIMLACQANRLRWLAPVGKMALTNYLMQSIICTLIFYGHGLGQFATFSRVEQLGLVTIIWTGQILISNWWLKRYRFGPMEWLWRSLSYWKLQSLRNTDGQVTIEAS